MYPDVFIWHTCFFYCCKVGFFEREAVQRAGAGVPGYFYSRFKRGYAFWRKVTAEPEGTLFVYYITAGADVRAQDDAEIFGAGAVVLLCELYGVGDYTRAFPARVDYAEDAGLWIVKIKGHAVCNGNAGHEAAVYGDYAVTDFVFCVTGFVNIIYDMCVVKLYWNYGG